MSKTPFEIRLELLQEARHILQAQAKTPDQMPSTSEIIQHAQELNKFISQPATPK